jgi:extracellular factor (EF) 3-hydroxypalmitic acid methyl ester biosynthesis protein
MTPPKLVVSTRSYEELDGGHGREVFFRPHRYRAQDLAPLRPRVSLHLEGAVYQCSVVDVSQNGVAFESPIGPTLQVGDTLADLEVAFDEHVAYRGDGRVESVRVQDGAAITAVSLSALLLGIDEVLHLRDIRGWTGQNGLGLALPNKPWLVKGNDRFKVLVSELGLFLEDSEQQLASLESQLAWHVIHGEQDSPARAALIERLHKEFVEEVVRYSNEIDATLRDVPPKETEGLKQYSLRHVHEFLMRSPCLQRALEKPFGYPGDYEVMRFIYERQFEGATLFAKAVQLSFLSTAAPTAVRTRKDMMKAQLRRAIEEHRGERRPLRILSVATGPAQELLELFKELSGNCPPIELVLFDQDKGALAFAYRRLTPVLDERWGKQIQVLYLHDSIKRLLRDGNLFSAFGQFDVIFSIGLYDYLQASTAVVLTRNLVTRLAEGGSLYIGNMVPENSTRWIMEHHLDWHLIYRSRTQMLDIGQKAAPHAEAQIVEESTGVNPFLQLTLS